jgi:polyisoprenoid-binding protein YceI
MLRKWIWAVLVACPWVASAESVAWTLDKAHSTVSFSVTHLGLTKVRGSFGDFDAVLAGKKNGELESVQATVKVGSIDTGIAKRDEHLKNDDFFSADKFPEITFKTLKITYKKSAVTAEADLTMHGVTKKVVFKGEFHGTHKVNLGNGDQMRAGYTLHADINRKDFGLTYNSVVESVSVISDQVHIEIDASLFHML